MHEIGIARQILRTVERFAAENGVDGIDEVVCDNGELSLVIPEYLEKTYPMVVKGTILQEAKLTLNTVPGLAECDDCDEIFNVVEHKGYCPSCGSFRKTVLSGKTFSVKEIIVKETGDGSLSPKCGNSLCEKPCHLCFQAFVCALSLLARMFFVHQLL